MTTERTREIARGNIPRGLTTIDSQFTNGDSWSIDRPNNGEKQKSNAEIRLIAVANLAEAEAQLLVVIEEAFDAVEAEKAAKLAADRARKRIEDVRKDIDRKRTLVAKSMGFLPATVEEDD